MGYKRGALGGVVAAPPTANPPVDVVVIGEAAAAQQAVVSLKPTGVTAVLAPTGDAALRSVDELTPEVVVVGRIDTAEMSGSDLVRRLRARPGKAPRVIVLGEPDEIDLTAAELQDGRNSAEDYLAADVNVAELVDHIHSRLHKPPEQTAAPSREAWSEPRLMSEIERELQRAQLSRRPGILAVINIAELAQLRRRLGSQAEQSLAAAFAALFAEGAPILEQHSSRADGGFYVLMPETDAVSGRQRLRALSRRIAAAVIDIGGEQVHVTPIIGYAAFSDATTGEALRTKVDAALRDAERHLDLVPVAFTAALDVKPEPAVGKRDLLLALIERLRSPLQIAFTLALLVLLPFLVYVIVWYARFDLTTIVYPLVAGALAATALSLWLESFRAAGPVDVPDEPASPYPPATRHHRGVPAERGGDHPRHRDQPAGSGLPRRAAGDPRLQHPETPPGRRQSEGTGCARPPPAAVARAVQYLQGAERQRGARPRAR